MFESGRKTDSPITPLDDSQVELRTQAVDVNRPLGADPFRKILDFLNPFGRPVHSRADLTAPSASTQSRGIKSRVLTSVAKKRTRKNKVPPKGNNQYGRSGTLSCGECRSRKHKCSYRSAELPCEFCISRGIAAQCVKINASTFRQPSASRPIPTPVEAIISSDDELLLEYSYSNRPSFDWMTAFFRFLAVDYGPAIPSETLRHAILSYSALELPADRFLERSEDHERKAWRALIHKISEPAEITEADVFASFILSWIAGQRGSMSEAAIHVNGCLSMLQRITESNGGRPVSDLLELFGPCIRATLDMYATCMFVSALPGVEWAPLRQERTSLKERSRYIEELFHVFRPSEQVNSIVLAAAESLGDLFSTLAYCISTVIEQDLKTEYQRSPRIERVLEYASIALTDVELETALVGIRDTEPSIGGTDQFLTNYERQIFRSIELAKTVLQSPSIIQGLCSPEAKIVASTLMSSFRSLSPFAQDPRAKFYITFWYHPYSITLAALALPTEDVVEYSDWIYNELDSLGCNGAATALAAFWGTGSTENAAKALKGTLSETMLMTGCGIVT